MSDLRTIDLTPLFEELRAEIREVTQAERAHETAAQVARARRESAERTLQRLAELMNPPAPGGPADATPGEE